LHFCLTDPVPMYYSEPFAWEVSLLLAGSVDAGPDTCFGYSAGVHPDCTDTLQLVGAELSTPGSGSKPLPTAGAGEGRLYGVLTARLLKRVGQTGLGHCMTRDGGRAPKPALAAG